MFRGEGEGMNRKVTGMNKNGQECSGRVNAWIGK
jgi:hypothetical protein